MARHDVLGLSFEWLMNEGARPVLGVEADADVEAMSTDPHYGEHGKRKWLGTRPTRDQRTPTTGADQARNLTSRDGLRSLGFGLDPHDPVDQ